MQALSARFSTLTDAILLVGGVFLLGCFPDSIQITRAYLRINIFRVAVKSPAVNV